MSENQEEKREEKIVCPYCHHENDANITRCAQCGKELIKTISVPEIETSLATQVPTTAPQIEVAPDALTLLVTGFKSPISALRKRELVIGRRVPDYPIPDVDLSGYNAYRMGVSRRHAVLHCSEDGCTIEDQASANSSWVNENKLTPFVAYPLQSGDTIRLGHLVMYIYFSTIDSVYLFEAAAEKPPHLTPDYLVKAVGPYLQALADLQGLINATLDREPAEIGVGSIRHDTTESIQVTLRKATEAINLALKRIMPWRKEHSPLPTDAALEEALQSLAGSLIDRINPDMPASDRPAYISKLVVPVRVLVHSPLHIAESPPKKR
jgi:hypothetical protein